MNRSKNTLPLILTGGILGLLFGALLIFIDFSKVLSLLFIIIGIVILIANLPSFIYSVTSMRIGGIISTAIPILAGILMIFWHSTVLLYILGAYLIVFPLIRIFLSEDKALNFRIELPRLIIGTVLFLIGPGTAINVLFDVAGYVVIALSLIFTILGIIKSR